MKIADESKREGRHPADRSATGQRRTQSFRSRRSQLFLLSLLLLFAVCAFLGWTDFAQKTPAGRMASWFSLLPLSLLVWHFFPRSWSGRYAFIGLLVVSAVARLLLFGHPPSTDVNRYLWEGKLVREGISPYAQAAESPDYVYLRDQYWAEMNHKDACAIYPPLAQLTMAAAGGVIYHPNTVRTLVVTADLGVIALMILLLRRRSLPDRNVLLYALNPLPLFAFAAEVHYDSLMLLPMLAALYLWSSGRRKWGWLLLGVAIQIKLVALLLAPFLWRDKGWRDAWVLLPALLIPALPFLGTLDGLAKGLANFGGGMSFNGPIHYPLEVWFSSQPVANVICGVLLVGWIAWVWFRRLDLFVSAFLVLTGLLLLSSSVHYWYLTWFFIFIPLFPRMSWMVLSGVMGLYFVAWGHDLNTGEWFLPAWAFLGIWVPFFALLLWESRHRLLGGTASSRPLGGWLARSFVVSEPSLQGVQSGRLAIIIPTLNEGRRVDTCLDSVERLQGPKPSIIVADGGSTDGTVEIARRCGADIVSSPSGRGTQIAAALRQTTAEVVLVLHADATVESDVVRRIREALIANPEAVGGAVGMRFSVEGAGLCVTEFLNECRAALGGAPFGDQGQFFRRRALERAGGFPEQPLFEDVELSIRIRQTGSWLYLGGGVHASARRWIKDGWARRFCEVSRLYCLYSITPSNKRAACAGRHYETYYSKKGLDLQSTSGDGGISKK